MQGVSTALGPALWHIRRIGRQAVAVAVAALTFRKLSRFAPARQGPLTHAHLAGNHGLGQPLLLELTSLLVLFQTLGAAALSGGLRSASSRRMGINWSRLHWLRMGGRSRQDLRCGLDGGTPRECRPRVCPDTATLSALLHGDFPEV